MKKTIAVLFSAVFILYSCKQNKDEAVTESKVENVQNKTDNLSEFLGSWEMKSTPSTNNDTFSINLSKSKSGKLTGYYCAVVRNGNKIDCSPDQEININEVKNENGQYTVSFNSFFGAKNGEAVISAENGKLHWHITKKPAGEFYAPSDVFLSRSNQAAASSSDKSAEKSINENNYKGSDITMSLYRNIIEEYGCGDNSVMGKTLGKSGDYEVFIVENNCGDFPFKDLISVKDGKTIDKLTIMSSSFDVEKSETKNIKDERTYTFNIAGLSNINIKEVHSINDQIESTGNKNYFLNKNGKFEMKN